MCGAPRSSLRRDPPSSRASGKPSRRRSWAAAACTPRTATIDDEVKSEGEAFQRARRFLSYLPSSVHELAARTEPSDPPERRAEELLSVVPREERRVYKMRPILTAVLDQGSWFEIGRSWGKSVITGLSRLDGWPVAVLASDPYYYHAAR